MKIQVCVWKTCKERFSEYILNRLENDKKFYNFKDIEIETCPCTWNCNIWPSTIFDKQIKTGMSPTKASKILLDKLNNNKKKK